MWGHSCVSYLFGGLGADGKKGARKFSGNRNWTIALVLYNTQNNILMH